MKHLLLWLVCAWCLSILLITIPQTLFSEEIPFDAAISQYKNLMEWKFNQRPIVISVEGITFSRDCAVWFLDAGRIRLMEPASNGVVTGMVFEGQGRFQMTIPDPVEARQFKRFSNEDAGNEINEIFTRLVLRTSEDFLSRLVDTTEAINYVTNDLARERHEEWLKFGKEDVDARVLSGLLNPGDEFLCVAMETKTFGWVTYLFDGLLREEIQLLKQQKRFEFLEIWLSLDRASDRKASGHPSPKRNNPIDIIHFDVEADLRKWHLVKLTKRTPRVAEKAFFSVVVRFNPLIDGHRAILLSLYPFAKVTAVSTLDKRELPFIRDRISRRAGILSEEFYDDLLTIIFDKPLVKNEERKIKIDYELKIRNFVSGGSWYPDIYGHRLDCHTMKLKILLNKKYDVMAVGECLEETVTGNVKTCIWRTELPTKIYGFTVGEKFKIERLKLEDVPEVISFGEGSTLSTGNMVKNVAVDVAKSLEFYQWFYDMTFPVDTMHATYINSSHGQAFHGFIHLAKYTYDSEHPGASELFRAHEVAHQLWGHMVGWKTYRDQWLSEAFAEYSAMLFIETTMPDTDYFNEILKGL